MTHTDDLPPINLSWATASDLQRFTTVVPQMGKLILHDLHIAKDAAGNLYYYKGGKYHKNGESAIAETYIKILNFMQVPEDWNSSMNDRIIKWIGIQADKLLDRPELCRINLLNGIYDWDQNMFTEH